MFSFKILDNMFLDLVFQYNKKILAKNTPQVQNEMEDITLRDNFSHGQCLHYIFL